MSIQINLKLTEKMFDAANSYAELKGFANLQDFIRETLREKLFDEKNENIGGVFTSKASEHSLRRMWSSKKEDKAWRHMQKETL